MTDYEKIDAALGAYALGVSVTIFYFTVLTSYLIVAYFAGKNLTKSQVGVITGLFIIAALYATWGSSAFMAGGRFFQESTASVPMYSRKI